MTIKRDISVGIGAITPQAWAQIVDKVNENDKQRRFAKRDGQNKTFIAKITGATKVSGVAKWEYDFVQVRRTTNTLLVATASDGISSLSYPTKKAINVLELGNTAGLAFGIIVTTNGVAISTAPTYEFKPVPTNAVVEMSARYDSAGLLSFEFCAMNPIDGDCPSALVGQQASAETLTGTTLVANVVNSSLTTVGVLANLTVTNAIVGSVTGNSATATNVAYSGLTGTVPTWNQSTTGNALTATTATSATTAGTVTTPAQTAITSVGTLASLTVNGNPAITSNGYKFSIDAIKAKTASHTLTAADNGRVITMNVATANTLTVPSGLAEGFNCTIIQIGAGQTTITASGTTLNSVSSFLKISAQNGSASIISYASNVYNVAGSLSA